MTYSFDFITDDRFGGTREKLIEMDRQLRETICNFPDVVLRDFPIRELHWSAYGNEPESVQWRKTYLIDKSGRKHTWEEVFHEINKIYVPHYDRVRPTYI